MIKVLVQVTIYRLEWIVTAKTSIDIISRRKSSEVSDVILKVNDVIVEGCDVIVAGFVTSLWWV